LIDRYCHALVSLCFHHGYRIQEMVEDATIILLPSHYTLV
jgi:hypothetical protein